MTQEEIEKLAEWALFDNEIIQHGTAPHFRDYDVIVDRVASSPSHTDRNYTEGRYRYRFTHCVFVQITTKVQDIHWNQSWSDTFINFEIWNQQGAPEGYVWGVNYIVAYPGLLYVEDSQLAADWTSRLSHAMHEVVIETNCQDIRLVFHALQVTKIRQGDPETEEMVECDIPIH